jgi:hypothetical protein
MEKPTNGTLARMLWLPALIALGCGEASSGSNGSGGGGNAGGLGGTGAAAGNTSAGAGGTAGSATGGAGGRAGAGGAAGLGVTPSVAAVEGVWHLFQQSKVGECVEPTDWTDNTIWFKYVWNASRSVLQMFSCSDATTCATAPDYLELRIEDGHFVARSQNVTATGCQWEQKTIELHDDGVLREVYGTYTVEQGCGPNQQELAVCSQGWMREARRPE